MKKCSYNGSFHCVVFYTIKKCCSAKWKREMYGMVNVWKIQQKLRNRCSLSHFSKLWTRLVDSGPRTLCLRPLIEMILDAHSFASIPTQTIYSYLSLFFLMNKSWKDERLNVSVTGQELNRCSTHKNLMSAQPSGLSASSTSLRQTTRLPNNCSYWSSGKTTEWAIMDQSDRYTVCVCVCLCECTALDVRQPKSFTAGALKSRVSSFFFSKQKMWIRMTSRAVEAQLGAASGRFGSSGGKLAVSCTHVAHEGRGALSVRTPVEKERV